MSYSAYNYKFYQLDRIGDDNVNETQNDAQNSRYANYTTSNFFSEFPSDSQIKFATAQPIVMPNGMSQGHGLVGGNVDVDSKLMHGKEQERAFNRLSLIQRPFVTVPYLGRGSVDPNVESHLIQGEIITDKKGVTTVTSQSFLGHVIHPKDSEMAEHVNNTKYTVEESAMCGWVRGGIPTRDQEVDMYASQQKR
jgi:hypothetical protein